MQEKVEAAIAAAAAGHSTAVGVSVADEAAYIAKTSAPNFTHAFVLVVGPSVQARKSGRT